MGRPIYVTENLIDYDSLCCVSSEDDCGYYDMENVYDLHPGIPLRFEGHGSIGNPEWLCVEFTVSGGQLITFIGMFCHNLTLLEVAGDELRLKGCDGACIESGACDWNMPDKEILLEPAIKRYFPHSWARVKMQFNSYRLDIIDQANAYAIDLGEVVLGQWQEFGMKVHLQPGRPDGPVYAAASQDTQWNQNWFDYFSKLERLDLIFKNINTADQVDEIHAFIDDIMAGGNRFVIVPDHDMPWCYYVRIAKLDDFAEQQIYGENTELREWRIPLRTITCGRRLL